MLSAFFVIYFKFGVPADRLVIVYRSSSRTTRSMLCSALQTLPGSILQQINLPNLKPDSLSRLMLVWQKLVTGFEPPSEDDQVAEILAFVKFSTEFCSIAKQEVAVMDNANAGGTSDDVKNAVHSIAQYASSLARIVSAKSLKLMLGNPKGSWDVGKMLVPEHRPLGAALLNIEAMETETNQIKQKSELKDLLPKLSDWESIGSALAIPLINDKMMQPVKICCEAFDKQFEVSIISALKTMQGTLVKAMKDFIQKYKPVTVAAADWAMDPVMHLFDNDGAKPDFKAIKITFQNVTCACEVLSSLYDHSSGVDKIKSAVTFSGEVKAAIMTCFEEAKDIAGIVVFCGHFWEDDPEHVIPLPKIASYCEQNYGFKMEKLPGKLAKMVQAGMQENPEEVAKAKPEKKKIDTVKKDKNEKKEKKEKKDKIKKDKNDKKKK